MGSLLNKLTYFFEESVGFFNDTPAYVIIIVILSTLSIITFLRWFITFTQCIGPLEQINAQAESDENGLEELSENQSFLTKLSDSVINIAKGRTDMSTLEIRAISEEKIFKGETALIMYRNAFMITGLLFTVYGLFQALQGLDLEDHQALTANFTQITSRMILDFKLAFFSTIWGIIFAFLTGILQYFVSKKREVFEDEFILYASNILIPNYSIPTAEKDLGKLVRSLTGSSSKLADAATSIEYLARNTQIGTDNIVNAVDSFSNITDRMSDREDRMMNTFNTISQSITELSGEVENIIQPIEKLRTDILDRDIVHSAELKHLRSFYDNQLNIEKSINDTLTELEKYGKSLSDFFGDDNFKEIFKDTVKSLTGDQTEIIKNSHKTIIEIKAKVEQMLDVGNFAEDIDDLKNNLSNLRENISSTHAQISDELKILKNASDDISEKLGRIYEGENKIFNIEEKLDKCNELNLALSSKLSDMDNLLTELHTGIKDIDNNTLIRLADDMENITTGLESLNIFREDIAYIKNRINKLGKGGGVFDWLKKKINDK